MKPFQHIEAPLRLFSGPDSLRSLAAELDRAGCRRAVVFCGGTVSRADALLGAVRRALGERLAGVFDRVKAHSPLSTVEAGAQLLAQLQADAAIAVGGGSAIVTARAASIVWAEGRPVAQMCSQRRPDGSMHSPRLMAPKIAQFSVPTTPTTALVKAGSAVQDDATGARMALFDPKTRAQAVFLHPDFALSAPVPLAHTASLNTLAMSAEGLASDSGDPLSDGQLMQSLRLVARSLPRLSAEPQDATVRLELMLASILSGQGTDHASPGAAAALSHAVGPMSHVDNGIAQAIVLPHTLRFNLPVTSHRMAAVADALGRPGASPEQAIEAVSALLAACGVPPRLRDAGVPREVLRPAAEATMNDWFLQRNPRPVADADTLMGILEAAW